VVQHLVVLGIALTRPPAQLVETSLTSNVAVALAYTYPYAEIIYLRWTPGDEVWPEGGFVLVSIAAVLSFASLITLGKHFGVRPAMRGLVTSGPYRIVRHPMYLSYVMADIGYNLQEWNWGTVLLTLAGWLSLIYRIHFEERVLSQNAEWPKFARTVRYRLLPGLW
jgi:protein-S-isoprenylcysteine O-methyltransferase Ste14